MSFGRLRLPLLARDTLELELTQTPDQAGAEAPDTSTPDPVPWLTLAQGAREHQGADRLPGPGRTLAQLVVAAAVVLGLVLVGASVAASRLAEREAVNDAANTANLLALAVVQPAITNGLLAGEPAAYQEFDRVIRTNVLPRGIVRVKLWHPDGTIVYADEERLVGQHFELDTDQLAAIELNQTRAEVSELSRSENEFERYGGKLLEVYRPVWGPGGQVLLFEVYGEYTPVRERTDDLWRGLAGLLASSLMLLLVLMMPILWKVLDRLREAHDVRIDLMRRAVDASDEERRRIAATLHDGPVQELVASSLAVSGAAAAASGAGQEPLAEDIRSAATTVRASVASLRSLLVDLYPDRLADAGLAAALADLVGPLRARGTTVNLDLDHAAMAQLDEAGQRLVYRVTRECLINVVKHSGACTVDLQVRLLDPVADDLPQLSRFAGEADWLLLRIQDNGVGFDVPQKRSRTGHFGLRVITDLAQDCGGLLQVASAPGRGTHWRLAFPTHPGGMP